jgi:glucans biosynthesis protein C
MAKSPSRPLSTPRSSGTRRLIHGPETGSTASAAAPTASTRLPGLDALRSASMVAVVAAHAAFAYVSCRVAGIPWAVRDGSRSFALDVAFWSSISWAMPAFFTLGGFAAAALWTSRGPIGFARDRVRRIVAPGLAAVPTVLVPTLAVWILGWFVTGRTNLKQIQHFVFVDHEIGENRLGPAHLWFLEYLILMLAAYSVVRLVWRRLPDGPGHATLRWAGPFVLALPTTLILWAGHAVNGIDPIMDMRNSFIPNPIRWLHHAWFFIVGTWFYSARAELPRLIRWSPGFLALAVAVFGVRATLLREDLNIPLTGVSAWVLAGSAALFGWLAMFGLIGLSLRLEHPSRAVRYLSASSYWIYLTHFPIIGLIQIGLYPLPWPAWAKFAVSLAVTLGFGLLSYQGLVRHTILGRWLNGAAVDVAASVRRPSIFRRSRIEANRQTAPTRQDEA